MKFHNPFLIILLLYIKVVYNKKKQERYIMSIRGIKNKADGIYMKYRKQIIPEFFYVGYVGLLAQYLRSGLFSFFVSLFYVLSHMDMYENAYEVMDDEHPLD